MLFAIPECLTYHKIVKGKRDILYAGKKRKKKTKTVPECSLDLKYFNLIYPNIVAYSKTNIKTLIVPEVDIYTYYLKCVFFFNRV